MAPRDAEEKPYESPWLRRTDQAAVATLLVAGLLALGGHLLGQHFRRQAWIDIDRAPPLVATFQLDLNEAEWAELAQLPQVGETLARRIIESREEAGPFRTHRDLLRVHGIGPLTLERIRPYLLPMEEES